MSRVKVDLYSFISMSWYDSNSTYEHPKLIGIILKLKMLPGEGIDSLNLMGWGSSVISPVTVTYWNGS